MICVKCKEYYVDTFNTQEYVDGKIVDIKYEPPDIKFCISCRLNIVPDHIPTSNNNDLQYGKYVMAYQRKYYG
jgi:hypothetical protein